MKPDPLNLAFNWFPPTVARKIAYTRDMFNTVQEFAGFRVLKFLGFDEQITLVDSTALVSDDTRHFYLDLVSNYIYYNDIFRLYLIIYNEDIFVCYT